MLGCCCSSLLAFVGAVTLASLFVRLAFFLWTFVISPKGKYDPRKYGAKSSQGSSWAIITGSSDGIGKGFAEELAKDGFNLFLVSRTESKLKELSDVLINKYKIEARYLPLDLSNASEMLSNVTKIREHVVTNNWSVSMLVNNVGVNTAIPVNFVDMTNEEIHNQINVNVTFTTLITQSILPLLLKNKTGRSALINVSSISAEFPSSPFLSVYAGTKAYVTLWSKSLSSELSGTNCDVLVVSPAFVASNMSGFKKGSMIVALPNATARDTLNKLGTYTEVTPSIVHAIQRFLMTKLVPSFIIIPLMKRELSNTRQKLLKKKST